MNSNPSNKKSGLSREQRTHLIAALITLAVAVLIGVGIFVARLTYIPGARQTWPPVDSSEILLEGEYVMTGDVEELDLSTQEPAPAASTEEPVTDGPDLADAGEPAPVSPPVVTSPQPSPMKVKPPKEEPVKGPSKAEKAAAEAKARQADETRQKIAGQMKFGSNTSASSGQGKSGSADGNSSQGKVSGQPGYSLDGRTLAHWVLPGRTAPNGTVTVRVVVNQQGKVVEATVKASSGAAANDAVRKACVEAARKSSFSVKLDAPPRQTGTITYKFVS